MGRILSAALLILAPGFPTCLSVAQEGPNVSITQENPDAFHFLTSGVDFAYYPTWAPDGLSIAFSAGDGRIMRVPASGGPLREVIGPGESGGGNHPSWSPDGNYIAFDTGGGSDALGIRIISTHGGPPIRVVPSSVPISRGGHPTWSPDGSGIAFSSMGSIMVVELATGNVTKLYTPSGGAWARAFGWSPDGSRISLDEGLPDSNEGDVWILPVGGGLPVHLTDFPGREGNPVWSPDSSRIAFMASHSGNRDIWIIPAEGGQATQVTFEMGMDMNPRWSPDGQRLAFASDRGGVTGIWVVDLEIQLKETAAIH